MINTHVVLACVLTCSTFILCLFILMQDFCYLEDMDTFEINDAINMCVTVVAYSCDSSRGLQMLVSTTNSYRRYMAVKYYKFINEKMNLIGQDQITHCFLNFVICVASFPWL